MGWLDMGDGGFTDKLWDTAKTAVGSLWDWGTKTQAGASAVIGAGTGILNYMAQKDAPVPGQADREYMEQRRREHNAGITKAAERYKEVT